MYIRYIFYVSGGRQTRVAACGLIPATGRALALILWKFDRSTSFLLDTRFIAFHLSFAADMFERILGPEFILYK